MTNFLWYFLIVFLCFFTTGCKEERSTPKSGKIVKIGVIASISGDNKRWGENGILAIKTALILEPLLQNGDKPELIIEDDKNDPAQSVLALKKLVEIDNVAAVLCFSNSKSALAIAKVADEYKTPILALTATHPGVTRNNKYTSQLLFDDNLQGIVAALYMMDEMLIENVAVFKNPNNPHSNILANTFTQKFTENGGVVWNFNISSDQDDYIEILELIHEEGVNALYLPLEATKILKINSAIDAVKWDPTIMLSDTFLSKVLLQHQDSLHLINGMFVPGPYSTSFPSTKYGVKVNKIFETSFDAIATTGTGLACEGTSLLLAAIDRCEDSHDRECINNSLRSTHDFIGIDGKIQIHENGKAERPIFINLIKNGKLNFIVKIY